LDIFTLFDLLSHSQFLASIFALLARAIDVEPYLFRDHLQPRRENVPGQRLEAELCAPEANFIKASFFFAIITPAKTLPRLSLARNFCFAENLHKRQLSTVALLVWLK
jgi:hypothetical protein